MDVIEYINTISVNNFNDWVRCHNSILHHIIPHNDNMLSEAHYDKEIRIIGHILKVLYNEKITAMNKYYLLLSIEENLEYFVKTENGAIHLSQSLTTDFKNNLHNKWDHRYMCQLLIVIVSSSVYYDVFTSPNHQCVSFTEELLKILFDIMISENTTTNWTNLKHTVLTSVYHLESTYPTLFSMYEERLSEIVHKERSIYFEFLLQIYSLVFKNNIRNKCRLQHDIETKNHSKPGTEIYNKEELCSFIEWSQRSGLHESKIVGIQFNIFKSLRTMIEQAMNFLSPLSINLVIRNCLTVTNCLSQKNIALWTQFIGRFNSSTNLSILEVLLALKISSQYCSEQDGIILDEQLQETLLAILNNCRSFLPNRQIAALWLYLYPVKDDVSNLVTVTPQIAGTQCSNFEPEMMRHFYLRSMDLLEIKYCKLMLLNKVLDPSDRSDSHSVLLFSSLKEIRKSLHYFDSDMPSNILLRVMFAMHIRHPSSLLARDFESVLEDLVVQYPSIISLVMFYLNALKRYLADDDQSRNFSIKCLSQIAKLSSKKISESTECPDFDGVKLYLHVLNYVNKFSDIDIAEYLTVLHNLLVSCKNEECIVWLAEAYDLLLGLCFNIIRKHGSSSFYTELTNILNEIRNDLVGGGTEIKANFLYALMVSLPSKKIKDVLTEKVFEEINEKDFRLILSSLIQCHVDEHVLTIRREIPVYTLQEARYIYDGLLDEYSEYLSTHNFPLIFDIEIYPKKDFLVERFLYGVSVDFQTDSYFVDISPWHINFIRCADGRDFCIKSSLTVTSKESEAFSIHSTLAATKLCGTFVIYAIETVKIVLIDLCLSSPVDFLSEDSKSLFVKDLIKNRLLTRSFVSINFRNEEKLEQFTRTLQRFLLTQGVTDSVYLMFLPPHNHILLKSSFLAQFCRRVDVFTDLNVVNLIPIEEYLKQFEL